MHKGYSELYRVQTKSEVRDKQVLRISKLIRPCIDPGLIPKLSIIRAIGEMKAGRLRRI